MHAVVPRTMQMPTTVSTHGIAPDWQPSWLHCLGDWEENSLAGISTIRCLLMLVCWCSRSVRNTTAVPRTSAEATFCSSKQWVLFWMRTHHVSRVLREHLPGFWLVEWALTAVSTFTRVHLKFVMKANSNSGYKNMSVLFAPNKYLRSPWELPHNAVTCTLVVKYSSCIRNADDFLSGGWSRSLQTERRVMQHTGIFADLHILANNLNATVCTNRESSQDGRRRRALAVIICQHPHYSAKERALI